MRTFLHGLRAENLLSEAGVAATRRVKGVGPRQRATLLELLAAVAAR